MALQRFTRHGQIVGVLRLEDGKLSYKPTATAEGTGYAKHSVQSIRESYAGISSGPLSDEELYYSLPFRSQGWGGGWAVVNESDWTTKENRDGEHGYRWWMRRLMDDPEWDGEQHLRAGKSGESHVRSNAKVDPVDDDVGHLLKKLQSRGRWGKEEESTRTALISLLKSKNYIFFSGNYRDYGLTVGHSCVYEVPETKRGHLSVFAGRRIRIVCVRRAGGMGAVEMAAGVYGGDRRGD